MKESLKAGLSCATFGKFDKEIIDLYAQNGISAIEVCLPFVGYYKEDWKEMKKYADEKGVDLWSIHLPFGGDGCMFNIADKRMCDFTVKADEDLIIRAKDAGMKAAVIHPTVGEITDREEQFESVINGLNRLVKIGKREGIEIAVEVLPPNNIGYSADEMKRIMDLVPGAKICWDVNHLIGCSHEKFAEMFADKIVTVHMSDYDFVGEKHWLPGDGKIDWKNIIQLLKKINYTGPFMYEVGNDIEAVKKNYEEYIRGLINE